MHAVSTNQIVDILPFNNNYIYCMWLLCNIAHRYIEGMEGRIQDPVKHLTWTFVRK